MRIMILVPPKESWQSTVETFASFTEGRSREEMKCDYCGEVGHKIFVAYFTFVIPEKPEWMNQKKTEEVILVKIKEWYRNRYVCERLSCKQAFDKKTIELLNKHKGFEIMSISISKVI